MKNPETKNQIRRQDTEQEDRVTTALGIRELFYQLLPFFKKQKARVALLFFSVAALAFGGRALPYLFGKAVDQGMLQKNQNLVYQIALLYLALEVSKTIFLFLHRYLFFVIGNKVLFQLREKIMIHIQNLPIAFFDKNPTGRVVTRATNDVASLGELFTQGVIEIFSSLIILAVIVGAMFFISWKLTIATIFVAPFTIAGGIYLSRKIRITLRESKRRMAVINSYIAENVTGMKIIQLYDRVPKNVQRFEKLSSEYKTTQLKSVHLYALLWPLVNFANAISIVVAVFYGGYLNLHGEIALGSLIAFIMYTQDFSNPLKFILEKYQMLQNSLSGAERVFSLLGESVEYNVPESGRVRFKGEIEFKKLSFKYRVDLPEVLKAVDLKIPAGTSLALVGRTGSGKTSLISLIQRFYDPSSGQLLIDGTDAIQLNKKELRQRVGVIQQDNFLFRGTIEYNITLGRPEITTEILERAIRQSYCQGLIERHGGIHGRVEERGANLSAGERQLIAFARILAFDPDILILDEATANIDSMSEALIQKATLEVTRNRTSIIIAHRLSTIQHCDQIAVMKNGEIAEKGTHTELMKAEQLYYGLHTQI